MEGQVELNGPKIVSFMLTAIQVGEWEPGWDSLEG